MSLIFSGSFSFQSSFSLNLVHRFLSWHPFSVISLFLPPLQAVGLLLFFYTIPRYWGFGKRALQSVGVANALVDNVRTTTSVQIMAAINSLGVALDQTPDGALVVHRIDTGGAGHVAGLVVGDMLVSINDEQLGANTTPAAIYGRQHKAGDRWLVRRAGSAITLVLPMVPDVPPAPVAS